MGAGQFCTNPGIAFVVDRPAVDAFVTATAGALSPIGLQIMLIEEIAAAYRKGKDRVALGQGVRVRDMDEIEQVARRLQGQLTCRGILMRPIPSQPVACCPFWKPVPAGAGQRLSDGGEVADSMVHGGPYPVSSNFGATSVGTPSSRRFTRLVCCQKLHHGLA